MEERKPTRPTAGHATTQLGRRRVLGALGVGLVGTVAGCTGSGTPDESTPDPIALDGGKQDDQGGMIIGEHFGPNGQIFYRYHAPDGHENPAWFHTLAAGLFPYYFEHERLGWEAIAIYVTDYSRVEYDLVTESGETYISTHTGADTLGPAEEMTFVAGSGVRGGMGRELVPFSEAADVEGFVDDHGGSTVQFEDVTAEWLLEYVGR